MTYEMDQADQEILELLLKDARVSISQIAETIGLSRPSVSERIEKLAKRGILCGTTAVVDPAAVGLGVTAFVFARGGLHSASAEKRFRELLARTEILEAHTVAGDDCYMLKVRCRSIPELNELITGLGTPPLSLTTRTTIVLATHCEKIGGVTLPRGASNVEA